MYINEQDYKENPLDSINKALEVIHNKAIEDTLRYMPDIIIGLIVKTKGISQAMNAFKDANPDLAGREKEMMEVIQTIELENGALTLDEILQKVPSKLKDISLPIPDKQPHTIEEVERTANGFI